MADYEYFHSYLLGPVKVSNRERSFSTEPEVPVCPFIWLFIHEKLLHSVILIFSRVSNYHIYLCVVFLLKSNRNLTILWSDVASKSNDKDLKLQRIQSKYRLYKIKLMDKATYTCVTLLLIQIVSISSSSVDNSILIWQSPNFCLLYLVLIVFTTFYWNERMTIVWVSP